MHGTGRPRDDRALLRARPRALRAAAPPHPPPHQGPARPTTTPSTAASSPSTAAASPCSLDGHRVMAMKSRPLGRKGVVVGDRVRVVGDTSGADGSLARIVEVVERTTTLRRTADDDDPVERVIVSNADQLVVVTALADPEPRPRLIDRALVAAYDAGMAPLLCLTKADLADPETLLSTYRSLGVPWVVTQLKGEGAGDLDRAARPAARAHQRARRAQRRRQVHARQRAGARRRTARSASSTPSPAAAGTPRPAPTSSSCPTRDGWIIDTPGHPVLRARPRAAGEPHRGVPRPRRDDRGLPPRLHPRQRRAGVRARRGGRRRARPTPTGSSRSAACSRPARPPTGDRAGWGQPQTACAPESPARKTVTSSATAPTASSTRDRDAEARLAGAPPDASAEAPPSAQAASADSDGVAERHVAQQLARLLVLLHDRRELGPRRRAGPRRPRRPATRRDGDDDGEHDERPPQQPAPPRHRGVGQAGQGRQRPEDDDCVHDEGVQRHTVELHACRLGARCWE